MIRVLLADDIPVVRRGLRLTLSNAGGIAVLSPDAASGDEAVHRAIALEPDVVLMDVRMSPGDGISATRALTASSSPARVILLTWYPLDTYLFAGLEAGARGFHLKDDDASDIIRAVRAVHSGGMAVSARMTDRLARSAVSRSVPPPASRAVTLLTAREIAVVRALCESPSEDTQIAARLHIEVSSVKGHLNRINAKTGTHRRAELVAWAFRNGLVS